MKPESIRLVFRFAEGSNSPVVWGEKLNQAEKNFSLSNEYNELSITATDGDDAKNLIDLITT